MDPLWEDSVANRAKVDRAVSDLQTDMLVLPEMFSTAFTMSPAKVAEPMDGPTVEWMRQLSQLNGYAVMGSVVIAEGEHYFNRFVAVLPDGTLHCYDKRHSFSMAGENKHYKSGSSRVIFEYKGLRIMPLICYDVRFPVWSRNLSDYDMAIYVASWPSVRQYAWDTLLRARAIENQCFVAGVNRVGTDSDGLQYSGGTCLLDFFGKPIVAASDGVEQIISADVDISSLAAFRQRFPAHKDADNFRII